ncbi:MAG: hypothetical protein DDG58_03795 [Ardenticatenia bacterium]|nr:MAG: hypothetical protein DDG58_03795 [Ardenticatenia bacterium]
MFDWLLDVIHMTGELSTITPEQMEAYRRTARRREAQAVRAAAARRERALSVARTAAQLLKEQYAATRVVLYGSALDPRRFGQHSDIDLAAEGISPADFWRAWGAVEQLAPEFEINLIPLETASPSLLDHINTQGIEL